MATDLSAGKANANGQGSPLSKRLSKRVAELVPCSRAEAERYIEGGWVKVDGKVIELPQHRVSNEKIELDSSASLLPQPAITLVLHKPPGFDAYGQNDGDQPAFKLLDLSNQLAGDKSGIKPLSQHFVGLESVTPIETGASGLIVFTKDWTVRRKLIEEAMQLEHEMIVDVLGKITQVAMETLRKPTLFDDRTLPAAKVSVAHQPELEDEKQTAATGLRFALKGCQPGQIAHMCEAVGLEVVGLKRIRVGRVALSQLPLGQWRYLAAYEKF